MAKYGKSLAQVTIQINGKKQAEQILKAMQDSAEALRKKIRQTSSELETLAQGGSSPAYDAKKKERDAMKKELSQLDKSIRETKKFSEDVMDIMNNMSNNTTVVLGRAKRSLEALLGNIAPNTKKAQKEMEMLRKAIKAVSDEIDRRKGKVVEFEDIMKDLGKATPKQLEAVEKRLESLLETVNKNSNAWRKYDKQMRTIQQEKGRRTTAQAEGIMNGDYSKTIEGTRQAIEFLKKYQTTLDTTDASGISRVNDAIRQMNASLEEFNKKQSRDTLTKNLHFVGTSDIKQAVDWLTKYQGSLKPLSDEWREIGNLINQGESRLKSLSDTTKYEAMSKQFADLNALSANAISEQLKYWENLRDNAEQGTAAFQEAVVNIKKIKDLMDSRSFQSSKETLTNKLQFAGTDDIKQSIEWLKKYQGTLKPLSTEWKNIGMLIENGEERLRGLTETTKYEAMSKQFIDLDRLSSNALSDQLKYWQSIRDNAEQGTAAYQEAAANIKQINELTDSRAYQSAKETLTTRLSTAGTGDLKQAIEWLKKYQGTLEPLSAEWRTINAEIEAGNNRLQQLTDRTKLESMVAQFSNLSNLSSDALSEQQKYWESILNNAQQGTAAYIQAERKLQAVNQEITSRQDMKAGAVMGDLRSHSVSEIKEAIKLTEKLRDAQKVGSAEYDIYNDEIKEATKYLQDYVDLSKEIDMEDKWNNLTVLSTNALAEQKKYWQEMVNGAEFGSQAMADYQQKLEAVVNEEERRDRNKHFNVTRNPDQYGTKELEEAIKFFAKLRDEQKMGSVEWDLYSTIVNNATEDLKKFKDSIKMDTMEQQFANLSDLSTNAFAEQKKYWESIRDSVSESDPLYTKAIDNLKKMKDLEDSRVKSDAMQKIQEANSGNWDRTIEETQEAIKLIQEYKKQLQTKTDADAIEEANLAIEALNFNLGKAAESLMEVNQAKQVAEQVGKGIYGGTAEDIDKARKSLEAYRKTLSLRGNSNEIEAVNRALNDLARSAELGGKNLRSLDSILGDLKSASMEELQTAAKQLEYKLKDLSRASEEYPEITAQLRRVNKELEKAKKEWEGQESLFVRMTKRLTVYMAAYGSLSAITGYVKELAKSNLQLSDTMSDVEKTTGLSSDQVARLGKEIDAIDTRTTQQQLFELAAAAGQIGLKTEADILGFVKAANMITVSLNELGTEGTTALMKIATLTGEASAGTEKALMSIGSAINELTAASAATAGPIVDLMNRMGGIAAQSGITSAQMAAIGATADALGQSVEITGTSMNKFLATLMSSSDQIAYALNMDAKALRNMINSGKTMDAVIAVFEKMNEMGGLGKLAPIMGELGSEGARMAQVLASMAERVDFLKGQVDLSTDAYEKAISIQKEYNVKNENAIAILQRMGNALKETFVNSMFVQILTDILRAVYNFFSWLKEGTFIAKSFMTALIGLTAAMVSTRIQWVQTVNAMSRIEVLRALLMWLKNLATGAATLAASWKNLGKVLKANWFSILIGALAGLATWIIKTATYVSEAAKATARYNRELQENTEKVDSLFRSLKRLTTKEEDRARIINQINQQYGEYLGFMLDEKDSADKLAAAHKLINAELRTRLAMNLQNTLTGKATNDYAEKLEKTVADISDRLKNMQVSVVGENGKRETRELYTSDLLSSVSEMINERVYDAVKVTQEEVNGQVIYKQRFEGVDLQSLKSDIRNALKKQYANVSYINPDGTINQAVDVGELSYGRIESYIKDLLEARVDYQKSIMNAEEQANIELRSASNKVFDAREKVISTLDRELRTAAGNSEKLEKNLEDADKALKAAEAAAKKYAEDDESESAVNARETLDTAKKDYTKAEKALKDHYQKMVDNASDYIKSQKIVLAEYYADVDNMEDSDRKKQLKSERDYINERIELWSKVSKNVANKVPGIDPWGKGRDVTDWKEFKEIVENIDTSSATALAAAYKKITEDTANIPENVEDFYNMFDTALDKDLELKDASDVAKQVHSWAEQIKNKLKTKFGRNTSLGFIFESEGGKKNKDEMEAALASLEAYYNERNAIIQQQALMEGTTQEELNRRLDALERERLYARIELRKFMVGKTNEFFTDIFDQARNSEYMAGIDYTKVLKQVEKGGKATRQKIEKDLTADMMALEKRTWTFNEEISRILLEHDPVKKVMLEYQKSFEKIDLMWSQDEERTKEAALNKMNTLLEFSMKRSELSDEDMKKQLKENQLFSDAVKDMDEESFKAFLILLDQYAEAATNAKRQATQQAIRTLEFAFENSELGKGTAKQLQDLEEMEKQMGELSSSGVMMEASNLKKQKEIVEKRIALELMKWETLIQTEKNGQNRQTVLQELMLKRDKATYQARMEVMKLIMDMDKNMFDESRERIDNMQGWGVISEIDATKRQRKLIEAELKLQEWRIDEKIRLEQEGLNRQDVIDNLKLAKMDALMISEQKLTALTMQEYQQRAQIANEWGTAIGNGLGEMIAGTEDAGKALVKNLATMAVQAIGQMAQMYVAKQLLMSQQNMAEAAAAMTTASTAAAEATAVGAAKTAEATAIAMASPDSVATYGAAGAARAAVISGLIAAAVAASIAIINSLFPGSAKKEGTNRKLSTGMLTYAEGNYPVLGNDGNVYDAKYEGANLKTGIYGGGAHFGIFSEKQPEMIVDGKTTRKLILNYPYIYDAITTIAKNGRLVNAMPTFAAGDYPAGMGKISRAGSADITASAFDAASSIQEELAQSREINRQLLVILQNGIVAHLDGLESHRQQKKNERFLKRRGID